MKRLLLGFAAVICLMAVLSGCDASRYPLALAAGSSTPETGTDATSAEREISQVTVLESGFSSASFSGDDGFEAFLAQGGASSDGEVTRFLASTMLADVSVGGGAFGCSTLTVGTPEGHQLFGRNFDWQSCDALVVTSNPTNGYASISTVNLGFISQNSGALGKRSCAALTQSRRRTENPTRASIM